MKDWQKFRNLASDKVTEQGFDDQQLKTLLMLENEPPSETNSYGKPLPGSAVIHQHPFPSEFERAIEVRRKVAEDNGDTLYLKYAEGILSFLRSIPSSEPLFLVSIATQSSSYEFAFCPSSASLFAIRTDPLENRESF